MCKVCGDENSRYRVGKRQSLCDSCNAETPRKVSREEFDKKFWSVPNAIPESVKTEFYDDYKTFSCTVQEYIKQASETFNR